MEYHVVRLSMWSWPSSNVPAYYLGDSEFFYCDKWEFQGHTFYLGSRNGNTIEELVEGSTGIRVVLHTEVHGAKTLDKFQWVYIQKLGLHQVNTDELVARFITNSHHSKDLWMTIVESGLLPRLPWEDLPF